MDPRSANRRQFLTGQFQPVAPAADEAAIPQATPRTYLLQLSRRAMACEFEALLNVGQYAGGEDAALDALDVVDVLEGQLSIYRETSELSRVNLRASSEPVAIEPRLFELLQHCQAWHQATEGALDVAIGAMLRVWGFVRRQGRIPSAEDLRSARERSGMNHVKLDPAASTVAFDRPGIELNLGAVGKGYALDRAAERLTNRMVDDFLLHGGQSSILARGARSGEPEGIGGWRVAIRHPLRPERALAECRLIDQAMGTSGSGVQHFYQAGKKFGHLLDPRTGQPAEACLSATVIAPSAAQADALSTAFYVLGAEKARDYCATRPEIAAILVIPGPRSGSIEVVPINLPDHSWRRIE